MYVVSKLHTEMFEAQACLFYLLVSAVRSYGEPSSTFPKKENKKKNNNNKPPHKTKDPLGSPIFTVSPTPLHSP